MVKIFIDLWSQSFNTKIKWYRICISLSILKNGHVSRKCWEQTNQQRQCSFAEHWKSFTSFYIGTSAPRCEGKPMENLSIFWHFWVMTMILVKWQSWCSKSGCLTPSASLLESLSKGVLISFCYDGFSSCWIWWIKLFL